MWISIKRILPYIINRLGLEKQIEIGQVCSLWSDLVIRIYGQNYKDKSKPLYLKNKTLFISCPNSVWANEFQLRQEEISKEINQRLGQQKIEKVRFIY